MLFYRCANGCTLDRIRLDGITIFIISKHVRMQRITYITSTIFIYSSYFIHTNQLNEVKVLRSWQCTNSIKYLVLNEIWIIHDGKVKCEMREQRTTIFALGNLCYQLFPLSFRTPHFFRVCFAHWQSRTGCHLLTNHLKILSTLPLSECFRIQKEVRKILLYILDGF